MQRVGRALTATLTIDSDEERVGMIVGIDEEVVAHVFLDATPAGAQPCAGLELARGALAVVDAEAQQVVVTHLPEQLLVSTVLLARFGKHLLHWFHFVTVTGNRTVGNLLPGQFRVGILQFRNMAYVANVVSKIQLEVYLRLCRHCCQQQKHQ